MSMHTPRRKHFCSGHLRVLCKKKKKKVLGHPILRDTGATAINSQSEVTLKARQKIKRSVRENQKLPSLCP